MKPLLAITNALADESRIRILLACDQRGELCVCQIQELLGLAASTVSKHLFILRAAGLLDSRKQGKWMYYRIADESPSPLVKETMRFLRKIQPATEGRAQVDTHRLDSILNVSPQELCCMQREGISCCPPAPGARRPARRIGRPATAS